ncbi:hypothetical protein AWC38_SpisGene3159 [Stylophora pistillata]|uniref:Sulfatase N-terminal domain-containing protein n=2 Tax=Stylophora pistillata TaxID=50429 RepID=A0A2B4SMS0_STYPI|nr:hypothetical protein AWC38_SpisGene3159 [Stylophora pistillata]
MAVFNNNSHSDGGRPGCKIATVEPFLAVIMESLKPVRSIKCTGRLYTEYEDNVLRLLDNVSEEHQVDEVFAEPLIRVSDFNVSLGEKRFLDLAKREVDVNSDFLKVTVRFKDGSQQTDFHASISEIPDVAQRKETHNAPLNIMVLGLDRTSSAHFQRMVPKTYVYLKEQLDSVIFKSYSIVGENTAPALSAFLTGKSLAENCAFKEARKGFKNAGVVDEWPFIFKDLKTLGIPTMWSEDQPSIGAFHFRLKGFNEQPTDHYGRSLWWLYDGGLCKHSLAQYKLQLQYLKSFMKSYPGKRKFGFVFLSDLCHRTVNLLSGGDDGFVEFFESLKNNSLLNNTLFITMGDHGPYTYGVIRDSPQGKLEHRLPFLSLTFPAWFKRSYPVQMAALIRNSRIITSPFDLYKTMKHLLTFPKKTFVEMDTVGASLFESLPNDRACEDTGIPEFYCPCLSRMQSIDIAHTHVHQAVKVAVKHINDILISRPITAKL